MTEAVATIDLPTQIACARRELAMRGKVYPSWVAHQKMTQDKANAEVAAMEAIIRTLEWLYANEAKVRAKVETVEAHDAEPVGEIESTNTYRATNGVFLDYPKGRWERRHTIVDEKGAEIGTRIVGCKTRSDKPYTIFEPYGFMCFQTAKAFIEAYERGDWKAKEVAPA